MGSCSPTFLPTLTCFLGEAETSLCLRGVKILPYLDDWLICASSFREAEQKTFRVIAHIEALGMSLNQEKSLFHPTQQTTFIGLSAVERVERSELSGRSVLVQMIWDLYREVHVDLVHKSWSSVVLFGWMLSPMPAR